MSAGLASQHFFGREVVSSLGMRLHLLQENPFDMLAGSRRQAAGIASSPPSAPPRATGRSILQIGSRLRAVRFAPGEHRSTSLPGSAHSFEPFLVPVAHFF